MNVLRGGVGVVAVTHLQDLVELRHDPFVNGVQGQVEEVSSQSLWVPVWDSQRLLLLPPERSSQSPAKGGDPMESPEKTPN